MNQPDEVAREAAEQEIDSFLMVKTTNPKLTGHYVQSAIDRACQPLQARLDALKPGTIEAITDGLWKFAEKECGHNPCSAKQRMAEIIDRACQPLQQRVKELEGALRMQLESSGDCQCGGCNRARALLRPRRDLDDLPPQPWRRHA